MSPDRVIRMKATHLSSTDASECAKTHSASTATTPPAPRVLQRSVTGTFLLSGGVLLSPVRESDLFWPMVPCCGDMVSIKAVWIHGAEHTDSIFPWHERKSKVYPAESRARARGESMVMRRWSEDEEEEMEAEAARCVLLSACLRVWALFDLSAGTPVRLSWL